MKRRDAKIIEMILRTICILSFVFVLAFHSMLPMQISFVIYFSYKVIREVVWYWERVKGKETHKVADTILSVERIAFYIIFIWLFCIGF